MPIACMCIGKCRKVWASVGMYDKEYGFTGTEPWVWADVLLACASFLQEVTIHSAENALRTYARAGGIQPGAEMLLLYGSSPPSPRDAELLSRVRHLVETARALVKSNIRQAAMDGLQKEMVEVVGQLQVRSLL